MHLDTAAFLFVYGLSRFTPLNAIGVFLAEYLAYIWAIVFAIVVFWPSAQKIRNRVTITVSIIAALIARLIVKIAIVFLYPRPRPFIALSDIHTLITTSPFENLQSFPSGHAIFFFAAATVIFCFNRKIGLIALIAAAAMGAARIYVGVHWPSDILVGAALGILTGILTYRYYASHKKYIDDKIGNCKVLDFGI